MGRKWIVTIIVVAAGCGSAAGQIAKERPSIVIAVYNDAAVPDRDLANAEERGTYVLRQADVNVLWANRSGLTPTGVRRDQVPIAFTGISLHIIDKPQKAGGDVFGMAFVASEGIGNYVDVFYGRIRALEAERLDSATVLGYVMAHEIGHLLLGVQSHSKLGIMQPRWEPAQLRKASMGKLLFTPEQSERMQSRLRKASVTEKTVVAGE
ncbi:MAG: hypothetical protein ACM3JB_26025 [Acidobacteriaceae bacterium]